MMSANRISSASLISGTIASLTSVAALAIAARIEGKAALQPINATSHWLNGERAGANGNADLLHTGVGYGTHLAATTFWAAFYEAWLANGRPVVGLPVLPRALVISAIAALVDYTVTPKRFTPGWELVLTKRSMAAVYVAMAFGLALGSRLSRSDPSGR